MNKNHLFEPAAPVLPFQDQFNRTILYTGLNKFEDLTAKYVCALIPMFEKHFDHGGSGAAISKQFREVILVTAMTLAEETLNTCQNVQNKS
jgi:hypothetical protein